MHLVNTVGQKWKNLQIYSKVFQKGENNMHLKKKLTFVNGIGIIMANSGIHVTALQLHYKENQGSLAL